MDSDLQIKRKLDSLDSELGLRKKSSHSADSEYQHQSNISNLRLSEKLKNLRYGIFLHDIKNTKSLSEESLTQKYNCNEVFIPRALNQHYEIAFLFYESLQNRDESFVFYHKKNSIEFEVQARNISRKNIIDDFIQAFDIQNQEYSHKLYINFIKKISRLSQKFITDIVLNVVEAFEEFERTLYPCRTSLLYFLFFKLYLFINKRWWHYHLQYQGDIFKFFKNEYFLSNFYAISDHNAYFCFDIIYQILNNADDDCSNKLRELSYSQLMNKNPEHLHNFVPQSDILEILCSKQVKLLFMNYIDSSVYEETITRIFEDTYVVNMGVEIQGTTIFNHRIFITKFCNLNKVSVKKGLMILIFLHELGHYVTRVKINTAKMALDCKSILKVRNRKKNNKLPVGRETKLTESGGHVEEVLFGYRLKSITYRAAEWISNPSNWSLPDFQKRFHQVNTDRMYDNRQEREIRIRSRCPRNLINTRCGTGNARLNELYIL